MFRALLGLSMALFLFSTPVQAGFEWIPPKEVQVAPQAPVMREAPMPIPMEVVEPEMPGYSAAPVMVEPLGMPYMPEPMEPVAPQSQNFKPVAPISPMMSPAPQLQGATAKVKPGLYINPYPLVDQEVVESQSNIALTETALAEQGGALRPVKLSRSMDTGVKSYNGKRHTYKPVSRPTPPRSNLKADGLTPIPGGEPAPLYEIEKAYGLGGAASMGGEQYANAVGFGRDLPLALSLSQVIPDGFTHSFAKDIDAGTIVSWEGGEPWNIVLNKMLREKNMTAVIRGKNVTVQPLAKL